jgi:hypothetical protein
MEVVLEAIHKLVPRAKPSPYTKRWWTTDLTKLRRTYTFWRNLARARRRAGQRIDSLESRAKEAAKEYHDAIRRQKKVHWDDFLADGTNIWQAAKYLKAGGDMVSDKVSPLKRADGTTTQDKAEQAEELLSVFFPPSDVIGLEAIWIGLDLSENCWTGFRFLEDLDWIGLIGNQLLELQWSNLIRQ